jgi:hypothetical protein
MHTEGRNRAALQPEGANDMAKETVERWIPSNLKQLRDALDDIVYTLRVDEDSADDDEAVYVDVRDLALVKTTLTDQSVVFSVVVRQNR